ncbi:MAG: disulfide oxidoreductase, partial [Pseudomonadota bacterium]
EIGQIAGRAGRYTKDGSFGVTGEVSPFDEDLVEAIENHRFKPLQRLMWRNSRLEFGTVPMLLQSLEAAPDSPDLSRAREASDLAALRRLWDDPEIADLARHPKSVKLLWQVCQIPDFRKVMTGDHVALLGRIYRFLASGEGVIPPDWIAQQVARLDRTDGDIDALSKRLAYIRTWTYVANRAGWLDDPVEWRQATRVVEDKLSDALHERLTQRFVDRRTSVLMRRLKQKERLVAEVDENGGVTVEGEFVGRLSGFRFTADESATGAELKVLQSASLSALQAEFARRADRLYLSPDGEIALTEQGGLMWGTDAIGAVEKGDAVLSPKVRVFVDDIAEPLVVEKVERRLSHWLDRRIKALFEPMLAMQADEAVTGLARGVAFQLVEAMGIIPRREIADDIKALGQDERALLRKHGVRFGQHHIFMPALLKPAPTRLRIVLWGLWEGLSEVPPPPPAGHVTVPVGADSPGALFFTKAGYRHAGKRAVRIDMLERLADMLRPLDARAGFEATPDMLSITGCTLEQFSELMQGLGFEAERGERPKAARPAPKPETSPAEAPEAETPEASETETTLVTDEAPSAEGAAGDAPVADAPAPAETAAAAEATATVETTAEATTPSEKTSVDEAVVAAPVETTTEPLADPADGTADETTEATASAMNDEAAADASPGDTVPSETTPDAAPSEEAGATTQDIGAEPAAQETEVFYTFRTRPRGRGGQRPRRDQAGAGERQGGERRGGGGRRGAGGGSGGDTGGTDAANASNAGGGGRRRARGGEGDEGQQRRNRDGQPGGKQG